MLIIPDVIVRKKFKKRREESWGRKVYGDIPGMASNCQPESWRFRDGNFCCAMLGKGERISDGEREKKRKKKGRKSSEKYVFVASGEVETGKGTKEGQLDNSVTKS